MTWYHHAVLFVLSELQTSKLQTLTKTFLSWQKSYSVCFNIICKRWACKYFCLHKIFEMETTGLIQPKTQAHMTESEFDQSFKPKGAIAFFHSAYHSGRSYLVWYLFPDASTRLNFFYGLRQIWKTRTSYYRGNSFPIHFFDALWKKQIQRPARVPTLR